MIFKILKHDWLAFKRSPMLSQSIGQNIFLGLFGLYLLLVLFSLGFMGEVFFKEYFPEANLKDIAYQYLIYWLCYDLIMRFIMQKFPSLTLKRYLTLNISRKTISHVMTSRSLVTFFNFAPFFFFIPFYFNSLSAEMTVSEGRGFWLMIIAFVFILHYLAMYLDRIMAKNYLVTFTLLGLVSGVIWLDFQGYFSLSAFAAPLFEAIANHAFLPFLLLVFIAILYWLNYNLLVTHAYLDDGKLVKEDKVVNATNYSIFSYFGPKMGKLMELDVKLILRNKRAKSYLYMSLMFALYPFLLGRDDGGFSYSSNAFWIFVSSFVVGSFTLNFGAIMFSMNSKHFDVLITQNISIRDIIKSKLNLISIANVFMFFITLPFWFVAPKAVFINSMMLLFFSGVVLVTYVHLGMSYSKRFEVHEGGAFSMQGMNAAHFLMIIPVMIMPILIYALFRAFDQRTLGIIALGVVGLICLLAREYLIDKADKKFQRKKYLMAANFKK